MDSSVESELQRLLRGEMAAAETHAQMLDGVAARDAVTLRELQTEHGREIIEAQLLPAQQRHIETLDRMPEAR